MIPGTILVLVISIAIALFSVIFPGMLALAPEMEEVLVTAEGVARSFTRSKKGKQVRERQKGIRGSGRRKIVFIWI